MTPEPHETPSNAPHFAALGVVFSAWNVSEGALPGAARTVWVSACGRIRCGGRVVDRQPTDDDVRTKRVAYWCRLDGTLIDTDTGSLLQAMQAGALLVARDAPGSASPSAKPSPAGTEAAPDASCGTRAFGTTWASEGARISA